MAKKLITFLGTNDYLHTKYNFKGEESEPVRYVQEAIAQDLCKDWSEKDSIIVFATTGDNGSIKRNWEKGKISKFDKFGQEYEKESKGLKDRLNNLQLHQCQIFLNPIPDGIQENEIWKIIEEINNTIDEKDELYIDITHSFRYIPMIIPTMVTFLKTTKNIELKAIYYGAFEVLGSPQEITAMSLDKRVAPIRELTELYKMIEWSEATNAFIKYGSGQRLIEQIDSIDKTNMDKKTKGIFNPLKNNINKIDDALKFNNVTELKKFKNPKNSKNIDLNKNPNLFALKNLLPQIDKFTTQWSDDEVKNGLFAAKWCLDNDRFAQALTLTQETMISYFCQMFYWNKNEKEHRNAVSYTLQVALGKVNQEEHRSIGNEWFDSTINEVLKTLKERDKEILENFLLISGWRNTINHAKIGDRTNMQKKFPKILEKFSISFLNQ